ncbi:MAG: LysM peptidoglycan-binding domain-containing protein [Syntrophaceae bacterium]|nr:LysM peptidoglycan-binding domain-containing protein [Syntrophaceae bacterium]
MNRPLKYMGMGLIVLSLWIGFGERGWPEERYTVKPGDTLYGISKSYGISIESLKKANNLERDWLRPKQVLTIPIPTRKNQKEDARGTSNLTGKEISGKTETYVVQKGDSLYCISKRTGLSIEEIKKMNNLPTSTLRVGQILQFTKYESRLDEEAELLEDGREMIGSTQTEGEKREGDASAPLGKWNGSEERSLFVRVVKTFIGVPYKLGGSTLKGIDCSAFVKKIYEIFNIQLPRTVRDQLSIGKRVERDQLEEGDLVFFKRQENRAHVGIYIGDNQFIHASYRNREVKIDHLDMPYFHTRFIQGVRVLELERES